jgi:hypothetical protein
MDGMSGAETAGVDVTVEQSNGGFPDRPSL